MKQTKRKGFNFFRSYFDVYNELNDNDKLQFIDALLNRQFLGIKPTELNGMAKFAYISQVNSIDSQVKGFEDKTGIKLTPTEPPCLGGYERGILPPTEQVEEKVEEKVKVEEQYKLEFLKDNFRIELILMQNKNKFNQHNTLEIRLKEFNLFLRDNKKHHDTYFKYAEHFKNWIGKKPDLPKDNKRHYKNGVDMSMF